MSSSVSARLNADLLDEKYAQWKEDKKSVEPTWSAFFEGFELGMTQPKPKKSGAAVAETGGLPMAVRARVVSAVYAFRTLGHTAAWTDPLSTEAPEQPKLRLKELGFKKEHLDEEVSTSFFENGRSMKLREMLDLLRKIYCGRIGFEFMHIHNTEPRNWLLDRIENRPRTVERSTATKRNVFTWLSHAELFERFLHRKYVGQKRFSLEGGESLLVALNAILERCPESEVKEIVMGMAHRGRLNVLANFLHKPLQVLLYEFSENYVPNMVAGDGDVKYHLGFETTRQTLGGEEVKVFLAANPSHLEAVNPVVEGKARSRQRLLGENLDQGVVRKPVLPILIHGDAAFAGQGSVAEVLNLSQLPGYRTGGTIHIVVNNQIGFTTMPADARSSNYCTDVAKMIEAPVIHVNGDEPLEVLYAAQLALDYRNLFKRDVVIDIVCYRRHGHNEGDEPAFTQPQEYREIRSHASTAELYRKELLETNGLPEEEIEKIENEYTDRLDRELEELRSLEQQGAGHAFMGAKSEIQPTYSHDPVMTGIPVERLRELGQKIASIPEDFKANEKILKRFLEPRRRAVEKGGPYNWAFAESLAFGTLLTEGKSVRLSGQDVRRGTFSQRHVVVYDSRTRERYIPLRNLAEDQATFWVYNSLLSEFAVLGFEYGYSLVANDMLIMWEAQFGDFANGAQVIVDQFIASAESKWQQPSHLVMLLPHGYEGQGPEHSSARMERFLQLCADSNMQVCNLTKPAQYFHLLRRQMMRPFRKPLVLMTPKSLLNHPGCVSFENDFAEGTSFQEIIDDDQFQDNPQRVNRLIFCSGKVYYDLLEFRKENDIRNAAIIRVEQLYPFHDARIDEIVSRYPNANTKWVWCQEEPLNMGGWTFIGPRLQKQTLGRVRYAGRDRAASTAAGAKAIHVREQKMLVEMAFSV